jgi:hypothetical protein
MLTITFDGATRISVDLNKGTASIHEPAGGGV